MGDPDIIVLSSDDESKPSVKVTSPKLSLKKNRTELTPDRKSDEGSAGGLSSERVAKRIKFGEPDVIELSNKKTVMINTDANSSESAHIPSSTSVASSVQVIELSDEPVVIEDRGSSPKPSLKRKRVELTPNIKCDEETINRLSSEISSKKIKFNKPDVVSNEIPNERAELTLNTYLLQQYDAIPSVSTYMAPSTSIAPPVQEVIELTDEPIVIEDRDSSRDDSITVSCWSSDMPENSNKKKNILEERKEKFIELLEFSEKHDPSTSKEEKLKIRKNMLKSLNNTQQSYVESENFNLLLDISFKKIKRKDCDNLVILGGIRDQLKKHKKKDKKQVFKGSIEDITISSTEDSVSKDNYVDSTSSLPAKITKGDSASLHTNLNFSSRFNEYCQKSEKHQSADSASCSSLTSESTKTFACNESSFHTAANSDKKLLSDVTNEFNSSIISPNVEEHSLESTTSKFSHLKNHTKEESAEIVSTSGIHLSAKGAPEHIENINADVNKKFDLPPLALTSEVLPEKTILGNDDMEKKAHLSSLQNSKSNSIDNSDSDLQITANLNNKLISDNSAINEFSSSAIASAVGLKQVEKNISEFSEHNVPGSDALNKKIDSYLLPSTSRSQSSLSKFSLKNDDSSSDASPDPSNERTLIDKNQDDRNAVRIKRLEKRLKELDKAIKKCQKTDLSLDDLDDENSAYMKESRYKKQFAKVHRLWCKLKKVPPRTGRIIEKKFRYEGSRYRLINEAVEKFIDKKKACEKFPDFSEILNVIKQVDERHDLGFNEIDISNEAKRVFADIGQSLKERRWRDERELLGCYLTDDVNLDEDPAERDEQLKETLDKNHKNFLANIDQVIDHYVVKQQEAPADENADDDDDEDDDVEEDEKEEDEEEAIANMCDDSDDLPGTAPASPAQNDGAPVINIVNKDDDDIEIINYSDKSTDQEEELKRRKSSTTNKPNVSESVVLEDSESSGDLPSIQELIGR